MSRIEEALEKAGQLRRQGQQSVPVLETAASEPTHPAVETDLAVSPTSPYLVTITDPDSPVTEEYRKLKSMVVKLTTRGNFMNTVMVTSTVAGEGKSITALNLAITLAQEYDHTVLLVDADLRRPSLHEFLGVNPSAGLTDCLSNGSDIGKVLIKTGIGRLSFLPSGRSIGDPVELLLSRKLKDLLKEIKHRYADRYVIIDTPPALPFAEVHSLSTIVDGVLFVVRDAYAPLGNVKEALAMLKDANVLGVVYNDVNINPLDSHYQYYYYKKYQYGKRDGNGKDKK